MKRPLLVLCNLVAAAASLAVAHAQTAFVSGLNNPSKIYLTSGGNLLATETGDQPNSGRVSIVSAAGVRRTLLDGLPSGLAAPNNEADGPNGIAIEGNVLYLANGEGDGFSTGTVAGTIVPNPKGPSSPLFTSVLKVTLPVSVDQITGTFTLQAADHYTILDGGSFAIKSSTGENATVELLTQNRIYIPDQRSIYRNSHPYGLALVPGSPSMLYMVDAGMNSVVQINTSTGRSRTITHFQPVPSFLPAPPVAEAVPDSVRVYGNGLLVTLLSGFPFGPYASQVVYVDPSTGQVSPFISNLSSAIDIVWNSRTFFVLEESTNMGQTPPAAGAILRYDTPAGTVLQSNVTQPTSMALDSGSNTLYVSSRSGGTITKYTVQ